MFTGLSLMDGTIEESLVAAEVDRRLSYVPQQSFNLWSTYRLPRADLTSARGAQFTGGYYFNNTNALTTANAAAIQRLTRYWLFNAMAQPSVQRPSRPADEREQPGERALRRSRLHGALRARARPLGARQPGHQRSEDPATCCCTFPTC